MTRSIEEFKPINPPHVGIYTCGPTVYREVHIGNFRTYLMADILRRTLLYNGYEVLHIKNITDVGHMRTVGQGQIDPIIEEALKEGKTPKLLSEHFTKLFLEDEKKLNILPATKYPKATEYIEEMIKIISELVKRRYAYETDGTVYFDVKKFKNYGQLSGNTLLKMDKLLKAVRVSVETDKKDSVDFALWKKAEPGRLMAWDSPWGKGFPGWHIECSAMSMKYLSGEQSRTIDIHTGGEDLIFPHHEDEIAQSEGVTGKKFVNYWVHGGYLLIDGEKMSRSKGNVYTILDLESKKFDPLAFRYLTFTVHYRSRMNFTWEALEAAQTALQKLREHVREWGKPEIGCAEYEQRFLDAINNDLNMPEALSIVWELVKSDYPGKAKLQSLLKFDEVLGLGLSNVSSIKYQALSIPKSVAELIKERERLRKEKKWQEADQIRVKIEEMGYLVEDVNGSTKVKKQWKK